METAVRVWRAGGEGFHPVSRRILRQWQQLNVGGQGDPATEYSWSSSQEKSGNFMDPCVCTCQGETGRRSQKKGLMILDHSKAGKGESCVDHGAYKARYMSFHQLPTDSLRYNECVYIVYRWPYASHMPSEARRKHSVTTHWPKTEIWAAKSRTDDFFLHKDVS